MGLLSHCGWPHGPATFTCFLTMFTCWTGTANLRTRASVVRVSNSSCFIGPAGVGNTVLFTSPSPFSAFVLSVSGGRQRSAGHQVSYFRQGLEVGVEDGQLGFLLTQLQGLQQSSLPLQGVHLSQYSATRPVPMYSRTTRPLTFLERV